MNNFIYNIPVKVYFGENQLCHLGGELAKFGKKVLLAYGRGSIKKNGLYDAVTKEISGAGLDFVEISGIEPNPRIDSVREGARICKENGVDVVLAVGGGSVIDASKWIAAAAKSEVDPWDFLSKKAPVESALPVLSVLTLSATGSEMDCGGVISNPATNDKIGRMEEKLLPKVSFLDPTLTYSVSAYQTACGSADMMSHIMEVYFTNEKDLYMLDCFMEGMMKTIIKFTPAAIEKPDDYEARANLMWTSSWAINGFIDGGKRQAWSCHSIEHQLSAYYDITHGLGLAIITPRWLRYCLDESRVDKYVQFGVNVFGIDPSLAPMEIAEKSIDMLSEFLYETLGLAKNLTELGIDETHFDEMAQKACHNDVIKGFKWLGKDDIIEILRMCL